MRNVEDDILLSSREVFEKKTDAFRDICPGGDTELFYRRKLECTGQLKQDLWQDSGKIDAEEALKHRISPLPDGCFPIVLAGGSFNNSQHRTSVRAEDKAFLDSLLEHANPEKVVFVVGHTLSGHEGYLVRHSSGRFRIFAIVPNRISHTEEKRLLDSGIGILVSIESSGMGLYKSFAYEIFKRMPSALFAFDGNSAALNLIQEARNGREKCRIFINPRSRGLSAKAKMLEGYIRPLKDAQSILQELDLL